MRDRHPTGLWKGHHWFIHSFIWHVITEVLLYARQSSCTADGYKPTQGLPSWSSHVHLQSHYGKSRPSGSGLEIVSEHWSFPFLPMVHTKSLDWGVMGLLGFQANPVSIIVAGRWVRGKSALIGQLGWCFHPKTNPHGLQAVREEDAKGINQMVGTGSIVYAWNSRLNLST